MDMKKVSSDHRSDVPVRQKSLNKPLNDRLPTSLVHVEDMTSSPVTQTDDEDRHLSVDTITKPLTGSIGERSKVTNQESEDDQTTIDTDIHATDSYILYIATYCYYKHQSFPTTYLKQNIALKKTLFPRCGCVCVCMCRTHSV